MTGLSHFRALFLVPGALRFFLPAALARWGVAMTGLAVFWTVQGTAGSFGRAGAATGAFAVADALVGPHVGRLIDRCGQFRVVPVTTVVFVMAAVALVMSPGWAAVGVAAVVGATAPPVGALAAARWRCLLDGTGTVPVAMSLEAVLNELTFLVGPVLVTALSATVVPWAGLAVAVTLVAGGVAGLITARVSEPDPGGMSPGMIVDRRLLNRHFLVLFAANLALGFFFGGIGVAVTAFALAHDAGALAGVITAAGGVVSMIVGMVMRPRSPLPAGVVLTAGCVALAAAPGLPAMIIGYALIGGAVCLVVVPLSVRLQQVTAAAVYTQAMTWINSASALGLAVAAPLVGVVVERHGWPAGFLTLAALTACLPLASVFMVDDESHGRP